MLDHILQPRDVRRRVLQQIGRGLLDPGPVPLPSVLRLGAAGHRKPAPDRRDRPIPTRIRPPKPRPRNRRITSAPTPNPSIDQSKSPDEPQTAPRNLNLAAVAGRARAARIGGFTLREWGEEGVDPTQVIARAPRE